MFFLHGAPLLPAAVQMIEQAQNWPPFWPDDWGRTPWNQTGC
jgi:hypothetical protein